MTERCKNKPFCRIDTNCRDALRGGCFGKLVAKTRIGKLRSGGAATSDA